MLVLLRHVLVLLTFGAVMAPNALAQPPLVEVHTDKAIICFDNACHPALVGNATRPGTYQLQVLNVASEGYGGNVLMYDADISSWYAIHRTYTGRNVRGRHGLYHNTTAKERTVTAGCINVEPDVFNELIECCRKSKLIIK